MRRARTWPWIRMRPFLARSSEPVWSGHLPSWADFITTTPELKFSVHTGIEPGNRLSPMLHNATSAKFWRASKKPGGQKGEQNRARDGTDCNHIDQVLRGHRDHRYCIGRRRAVPGSLAFRRLWSCLCTHCIPRRMAGQAAWQPDPDAFPDEVCPRSGSHHVMGSAVKALVP
jgi:hypothetical protein